MTERAYDVLFLCTHNSARSIMAEAILNSLAHNQGRFRAYSAGSHPSGQVNPLAIRQLRGAGIQTEGLRSKNWDEFAKPGAPVMDFVFTVCDSAAKEICPVWPGQPITAHWGQPDPSAVEGTDEQKRRAFLDAYTALRNRINIFVRVPLDKLDGLAIKKKLDEIGKS